jgi:LmbE family N-acetylglucosaminyl deacetylase
MMKTKRMITLAVLIISLTACHKKPTVEELQKFSATEIYPEDTYLDTVSDKRALIIVAHDDDDCIMAGTIAKLTSAGWIIKQLSFDVNNIPGEDRNPAHIICEGYERILEDGIYRPGVDTVKYRWRAIPYAEIKIQYLHEKVKDALIPKVNEFNPSVLFTLDNIKGGYGNPDHVFLSQLVVDLFKEGSINAERIYQAVITRHMETERDKWLIPRMEKWGYPQLFPTDDETYGIDGIPEPDVQINISEHAETKMSYLRSYPESVRKNLRKYIPYYEEFDAKLYFSIFDREFFRIIEK